MVGSTGHSPSAAQYLTCQKERLEAVIQELKEVEKGRKIKLQQMACRRYEDTMRVRWHKVTTVAYEFTRCSMSGNEEFEIFAAAW